MSPVSATNWRPSLPATAVQRDFSPPSPAMSFWALSSLTVHMCTSASSCAFLARFSLRSASKDANLVKTSCKHQVKAACCFRTEKKEKTTPFGVNLKKSPVLYQAAQPAASHMLLRSAFAFTGISNALLNSKTSIAIQKRHWHIGNLKSETPMECKIAFLHWGDG